MINEYENLYKDIQKLNDNLSEIPEKTINDSDLLIAIDTVIANYKGDVTELGNAIGVLILGRKLGWRPTYLLHSQKTIRRYEEILGLKFQEILPAGGPKRHSLVAWKIAYKFSNFWKLVKNEVPGVRTPEWRKFLDDD